MKEIKQKGFEINHTLSEVVQERLNKMVDNLAKENKVISVGKTQRTLKYRTTYEYKVLVIVETNEEATQDYFPDVPI